MPSARAAFAVALLVLAVAAQLVVLARLPLPGATPDLALLCVVALALAHGPGFGVVAGFSTGLAVDLVPPADNAAGRWALAFTVVGYLAGLARGEARRSAFVPVAVVAVAAAASLLLVAGVGALLGDPDVSWAALRRLLPTAVLYDVVLSAFVLPVVLAMADRVGPDPLVRR